MRVVIGMVILFGVCAASIAQPAKELPNTLAAGAQVKAKQTVYVADFPRLVNQYVAVEGLIGKYKREEAQNTFVYSLTDYYNGSTYVRTQDEPPAVGTRWRIEGIVTKDPADNQFYLIEQVRSSLSAKPAEREPSSKPPKGKRWPPGTIIGLGLIGLAVASGIGLIVYSQSQKRRQLLEAQLRRQQELERARAEAEVISRRAPSGQGAPGGTIVAEGAPVAGGTVEAWGQLRITEGPHAGQIEPLTSKQVTIGRTEGNVQLSRDRTVSSKHGQILATNDGRLLYKDESRNGSRVDGKPVHHSQVEIRPGAVIEVGTSKLEVICSAVPGVVASASPPAAKAGETLVPGAPPIGAIPTGQFMGAELCVVEGADKGTRYPIGKPMITIGRQDDQDLRLTDGYVSRKHATIAQKDGEWVLTNVSERGTKVNDSPANELKLKHGDRILMGSTVLEFSVTK